MKWIKKGHELEEQWEALKGGCFYIYGAGDYGARMSRTLSKLGIEFAFVDGNYDKQQNGYLGKKVISPVELVERPEKKLIILAAMENTMLEMRRILEKHGMEKNRDFWYMEEFKQSVLPVYAWYALGKIYMPSVGFLSTTICNLNCDGCLNFTAYNRNQRNENIEDLKKTLADYFRNVDVVDFFSYTGGEPFLHPEADEILEYIGSHYRNQIVSLGISTNCTIVPKDRVCEICARYGFRFLIDDYSKYVERSKKILPEIEEKLQKYGVEYAVNTGDEAYWIDLEPLKTDNYGMSEEELISYRDRCAVPYRELYHSRLYACNYANFGIKAGLETEEPNDSFDLSGGEVEDKVVFVEFIMGYTEKGYVNFCKHCAGFLPINPYKKPVGKQLPRGEEKNV